jgi:hypothetical protein
MRCSDGRGGAGERLATHDACLRTGPLRLC